MDALKSSRMRMVRMVSGLECESLVANTGFWTPERLTDADRATGDEKAFTVRTDSQALSGTA
jgi:hypothetical protein